jgi:hypothetical protein
MTMSNNDMIALFADVVGCMNIPSLEIKKMSVLCSVPSSVAYTTQVLLIFGQLCADEAGYSHESAADTSTGAWPGAWETRVLTM